MHETLQKRIRLVRNNLLVIWTFLHSDSRLNIPVSRLILVALALAVTIFPPPRATAGDTTEEKRARIRVMASDTLQSLYKMEPHSQAVVENSAGYAVFDNTGVHVVVPSTVRGGGIAVDSQSRKETFMKVHCAGGGQAMGAEDCRMVFVFETRKAFDEFLNTGWDGHSRADGIAGVGSDGSEHSGAFAVSLDMWVYEIVERGLAFQVILQGTKYRRDDKLNKN